MLVVFLPVVAVSLRMRPVCWVVILSRGRVRRVRIWASLVAVWLIPRLLLRGLVRVRRVSRCRRLVRVCLRRICPLPGLVRVCLRRMCRVCRVPGCRCRVVRVRRRMLVRRVFR